MTFYIGPEGPRNAKLAIVAEKPGRDELASLQDRESLQRYPTGRPLIGPTGQEVNDLLNKIGMSRSEVYLTNCVKHFNALGNPTDDEISAELPGLLRELSELPELNCIVPMGNSALKALTGFRLDGITQFRGSLLQSPVGRKLVPTYHPSHYMHKDGSGYASGHQGGDLWKLKSVVKYDLHRAMQESFRPELILPKRTFHLAPTLQDVREWTEFLYHEKWLSYDIEMFRGWLSCIAFSSSPDNAFCIPLLYNTGQPYWSPSDECYILRLIQHIFKAPDATFVAQNGMFDSWHLYRHGIMTWNMGIRGFDTMYAHRYRAPDLPHALDFLVSIYTREPYYKDESGDWRSDIRVPSEQFWTYNCKDAACTLEVAWELIEDMKHWGMYDHYIQNIHTQFNLLLDMRIRGMRVDRAQLSSARKYLLDDYKASEEELTRLVGWIPNTKSFIDMGRFYEQFNISYRKTPTGRPKSNEEAIRDYAKTNPHARDKLELILNINNKRTFLSGFTNLCTDPHDFYHGAYNLHYDKTGRNSAEGSDDGGPQLQNIPAYIRKIFIPDEPDFDEFTNADMKKAEPHVVAWLSKDPFMIEALLQNKNVHSVVACQIFRNWVSRNLPPDELINSIEIVCPVCAKQGAEKCAHSEYHRAKTVRNALNYKVGIGRLDISFRGGGLFIAYPEIRRMRDACITQELQAWWLEVENGLKRDRWLVGPLGQKREFYGLFDDKMVRDALSHLAQSTVGVVKNKAMYRLTNLFGLYPKPYPRIATETHDSVLINHRKEYRDRVYSDLTRAFNVPMEIHGRPLLIPLDISSGPNWGAVK